MQAAKKVVVVTGATGFLGSEVVRLAAEEGWLVRAIVRRASCTVPGANEIVVSSLHDGDGLRRAMIGASVVIHLAGKAHAFGPDAKDAHAFTVANVDGTANVIRATAECRVPKVVLASSVSVYGASADEGPCTETTACRPHSPYAVSKHGAEVVAAEAVLGSDTSLAILRFATVYGEGDPGNTAKLIRAIQNRRFVWPGDGTNRKSMIYRTDAARACLHAAERMPAGTSVFNVSAPPHTMQEIVSSICAALNTPVPRLRIPGWLLRLVLNTTDVLGDPVQISGRIRKFLHDDVYPATAIEQACGFRASTSLSQGMFRQVTLSGSVPARVQSMTVFQGEEG